MSLRHCLALPCILGLLLAGCDTQKMHPESKPTEDASGTITGNSNGLDAEVGEIKRGKAAWKAIAKMSETDGESAPEAKAVIGIEGYTYVTLLSDTETKNDFSIAASTESTKPGSLYQLTKTNTSAPAIPGDCEYCMGIAVYTTITASGCSEGTSVQANTTHTGPTGTDASTGFSTCE